MAKAIGIDLGTTYSCVGIWQNNRVHIIANDQGDRTTPSVVSFTHRERLFGNAAKYQSTMNPHNTVFNIKRLIGRNFSDPGVQDDMKHLPFAVFDKGGKPYVCVQYRGEEKAFSPEEISSMILTKMKETAESYLGSTVTSTVITVPAYFNNVQRRATKDAGTIAGLNVLRVISEPTAVAVAYSLDKKTDEDHNVLILDIGGGATNVSLSVTEGSVLEVKAYAGDTHLGGEDFDNRLVDHFVQEFKHRYKKDLSSNARALRRLHAAVERAKRSLSQLSQAHLEVDSIFQDIDFNTSLTRTRFEELCEDLFHRVLGLVEKVLEDAKVDRSQVHEIFLVGGSTRIPRIIKLVSDFFNGKELNKSLNPDEAAACGAAIQAAILSGDKSEKLRDFLLIDAAPLSLGIEVAGGVMTPFIKCNTLIPTKKSDTFGVENLLSSTGAATPGYPNDRWQRGSVTIQIYEGEGTRTKDNLFLDKFELWGIPRVSRATVSQVGLKIKVTFEIDENGILSVSASEETTRVSNCITIANDRGHLTRGEIERMISDAEQYKANDEAEIARIAARNALESSAYNFRRSLSDAADKLKRYMDTVDSTVYWLDNTYEASREEYEERQKELEEFEMVVNRVLPYLSRLDASISVSTNLFCASCSTSSLTTSVSRLTSQVPTAIHNVMHQATPSECAKYSSPVGHCGDSMASKHGW
ncbi:heat shock protein HSS1 [Trametes polyzona]|nr:heat shock protein HSS1 [Trametes polyzona]